MSTNHLYFRIKITNWDSNPGLHFLFPFYHVGKQGSFEKRQSPSLSTEAIYDEKAIDYLKRGRIY